MARIPFVSHLDTVGDGSGTADQAADYSLAPQDFLIAPAAGKILYIYCMGVFYKDAGGMDADYYGNRVALTNGITLKLMEGSNVIMDFIGGLSVKTNANWMAAGFQIQLLNYGAGDDVIVGRFPVVDTFGAPLVLKGDSNHKLVMNVHDDLSGLNEHKVCIKGSTEL